LSRTSVRIDPFAHPRLKALQADLRAIGARATLDEIASALVYGTTAAQAKGMLEAFVKDAEAAAPDLAGQE
jgi:hypothetical protein